MNKNISFAEARTITPQGVYTHTDALVVEEPLEIRIGFGAGEDRQRFSVAVTMRTPGEDEDLAVGFLFTEGILSDFRQVMALKWLDANTLLVELLPGIAVDIERLSRHLFTSSSCGVCGKASLDAVQTLSCYYPLPGQPELDAQVLYGLPEALRQAQAAFEATGGLHAAGLFDAAGQLLLLREDVGRHNAVDKVIGAALRSAYHLPFREYVLLVSGRAGFELVQKAAMAGLPVLAAVGAPTSLSVQLAQENGMTLVGFLRGERFNVYSHPERVRTRR